MNVMAPDVADMDGRTIRPQHGLVDSNFALDDPQLLVDLYEAQGYLLFRKVLDQSSVAHALQRMMAVMARYGVVEENAREPLWTGKPAPAGMEESKAFAGISRELVEHPANQAFFQKLLGEAPAAVPIVQYRSYVPHTPISMVHQDGFYSPGIQGFRPVWIPLMRIDPEVGGLTLMPGVHKKGLVHNLAKPPTFPIPARELPEDGWATTTYEPGDVLVIHPHMPHVGLGNSSDRVRFSIDTRIQSAAHPCVLLGDIVATTAGSVTLRTAQGDRRIAVTEDTYIRTGENRGARIPLAQFEANAPSGLRVVAAIDGDKATMIRRASEG
jgi:hypothetical protein